MNTRELGKDGLQITEIGLGAWAIGGAWAWGWGDQEDEASVQTIHKALDLGINWIDTAPVYGLGHSEMIVGQTVKDRRSEILIATKCGLVWDDQKNITNNNRPESIRKECEDSLRRLGTDYIDLYQIHWPDEKVAVEDSWGEMTRLQEEGKVRFIGVSNFDVPLLEKCQAIAPISSLQPPYSMVNRFIEREILPWCKENNVGVVAYSPLQNGLLTGKFSLDFIETLAENDWRRQHSPHFFNKKNFPKVLAFVGELRPIADAYDKTTTQLAIAWVLMHPAMTSAIAGARKLPQAEHNVGGSGWQISEADMEKIDRIFQEIFN